MPKPDFFLEFIHRTFRADYLRAQAYLEHFAECIESGKKPDKQVVKWMAKAIREHLDEGVRLEDAFALTKPRGRVRTFDAVGREFQIALFVALRIQDGETRENAIATVAKQEDCAEKSVERYYDRHRANAKSIAKMRPQQT